MMKMDHDYWRHRWQAGETGWHQSRVSPTLEAWWPSLTGQRKGFVLVPFCGKSLDMIWLREQGHDVIGVDVAAQPIAEFFSDNNLPVRVELHEEGKHYVSDGITLIEGDVLTMTDATLSHCQAVYDRGAMVAQTPIQRDEYATALYNRLPSACQALLLTVDYPQEQRNGPPFAVSSKEIESRFSDGWQVECLSSEDILSSNPGFQEAGVDYLTAGVYRLVRD